MKSSLPLKFVYYLNICGQFTHQLVVHQEAGYEVSPAAQKVEKGCLPIKVAIEFFRCKKIPVRKFVRHQTETNATWSGFGVDTGA